MWCQCLRVWQCPARVSAVQVASNHLLQYSDCFIYHWHEDGIGYKAGRILGSDHLCGKQVNLAATLSIRPNSRFPHATPKAFARSMVSREVCRAGMISTSFLQGQHKPTNSLDPHNRHRVEEMNAIWGQRMLLRLDSPDDSSSRSRIAESSSGCQAGQGNGAGV